MNEKELFQLLTTAEKFAYMYMKNQPCEVEPDCPGPPPPKPYKKKRARKMSQARNGDIATFKGEWKALIITAVKSGRAFANGVSQTNVESFSRFWKDPTIFPRKKKDTYARSYKTFSVAMYELARKDNLFHLEETDLVNQRGLMSYRFTANSTAFAGITNY